MIASVALFSRYLPYMGTTVAPKAPPAVVLSMDDVYLVGLGHNGKLWSARAKKVEIGQNRSIATLDTITDGQILRNGKPVLRVKAGKAACDVKQKNLTLAGGVLIRANKNQAIRGEGAYWNSATSTLRSIGRVEYANNWSRIISDMLEVNLANSEMNMEKVCIRVDIPKLEEALTTEAGANAR